MFGDQNAARLDKPTKSTINDRVGGITNDMMRSTSVPTKMQRDALQIANEDFKPLLAELRSVLEVDIKNLEKKLEAAGAPYTPGRAVEYGKN